MLYRILAETVLITHLGFVIFAVGGGLLVLRWRYIQWLHLPAAAWAALVVLVGWTCPLTPLEIHLRILAGQSGYSGGFLEHYLVLVLYPAGLTRGLQIVLGLVVLAINVGVYLYLYRRARMARHSGGHQVEESGIGAKGEGTERRGGHHFGGHWAGCDGRTVEA
jgi:hypothetical protein